MQVHIIAGSRGKTVWACSQLVFLGILLDGQNLVLSIPLEKRSKALKMLGHLMSKKLCTIKELQKLTGFLNFLTKAVFPGRAFTRRIYAKYAGCVMPKSGNGLKHYHHIRLDQEFKFDCEVWRLFLSKRCD